MKTLEEINAQIEEQASVLKKLRVEKDKIIENLSQNYIGKYIKFLGEGNDFCIMKITKVCLDEVDTPYKYYGNIFKFAEGDYRYLEDFLLFNDDFVSTEIISEEEYNEHALNTFKEIIK